MQEKELAAIQAQAMEERKQTVCFWCASESGALSLRGHYLEDCERHRDTAGQAAIFGLTAVPSVGTDPGGARACASPNFNPMGEDYAGEEWIPDYLRRSA